MSSFTFKGITSSSKNVIVEKLPPIVKPPKRYNLTEIDNASAVEIEELGYKAYEKTISIGFDDDDIASTEQKSG